MREAVSLFIAATGIRASICLFFGFLAIICPHARGEKVPVIVVGSKRFTESYVLAEIAKAQLARAGVNAEHWPGMGGTIILWQALRGGGIAAYPEYTGTIGEEILKLPASAPLETLAVCALFLYSLLPIVRNTATGLRDISPALRESARALGLEPAARLRKVYLPMASRAILAGIQTSAVINVGAATLAALIGAGGLGEPILSGLNLNDTATILQGALPAAGLAVATQGVFVLLDRWLIPRGLQARKSGGAGAGH